MTARLDGVAETRRRILDAVREIAMERLDFDPTLTVVSTTAGVSVQTVLRHFGTRDALLSTAAREVRDEIVAERTPPSADVDDALRTLVAHYESRGDFVLELLAHERSGQPLAVYAAEGRKEHRAWVGTVFEPWLPGKSAERQALIDLLVVATDVYTWKLLRRDRGHSVSVVLSRMHQMTDALLAHSGTTR